MPPTHHLTELETACQAGRAAAESLGSRRWLWAILDALGRLEDMRAINPEAVSLPEQARQVVQ